MKILLKYPSRSRPGWFRETYYAYKKRLSDKHDVHWLMSFNTDDETMNNATMWNFLDSQENLVYIYDDHASKIDACNADMEVAPEDWQILVLVSDDMVPVAHGFDDIIASKMQEYFPCLDGALNFPDGCCGDAGLITQSIMGRKLYEHFGYIYHPEYRSFYCDTEFSDVVREMGKCAECSPMIVKHDWKGENADVLAVKNQKHWNADEATYNRRKKEGWPK